MRYDSRKEGCSEFMLYDMEKDPKQFTNLAGRSEYAEIEKRLQTRLAARIALAKEQKDVQQ
jgi:hypothetical protein